MTKISVIVPIYNVENYLRECLDSITVQTLKELEIVCVNDGSTDSSPEIIREYAEKDPRIVVISGPNGGYGKGMNKGLDRASGEYIGIVEPDDYVAPEMFEELYETAEKNQLDFVKADFYRFKRDPDGNEKREYVFLDRTEKNYGRIFNPSEEPQSIRFTLNTWCGIYRRSFIEKYHIRHHETPGASFQDNGFFWQTFIHGQRAMLVRKPYYRNRRDNPNSSVMDRTKVYTMNIEYDWIQDVLKEDWEIWKRFAGMYWWKKYHNYMFRLERIDESFRKEYLSRFGQEFKRALQLGELNMDDFNRTEQKQLKQLMANSGKFYSQYRFEPGWRLRRMVPEPLKRIIKKILWR